MSRRPPISNVDPKPKASWRCSECKRSDGQGWINFGFHKHCTRCHMAKKDIFGGNVQPTSPFSSSVHPPSSGTGSAWNKPGKPDLAAQLRESREAQRKLEKALVAAQRASPPPPAG